MSARRLEPEGLLPLTPAEFHILLVSAELRRMSNLVKSARGKRLLAARREAT